MRHNHSGCKSPCPIRREMGPRPFIHPQAPRPSFGRLPTLRLLALQETFRVHFSPSKSLTGQPAALQADPWQTGPTSQAASPARWPAGLRPACRQGLRQRRGKRFAGRSEGLPRTDSTPKGRDGGARSTQTPTGPTTSFERPSPGCGPRSRSCPRARIACDPR